MSLKDYKQFADMIATIAKNENAYGVEVLRNVANELCSIFKRDNSRFDKERFLDACNIYPCNLVNPNPSVGSSPKY